MAESVASEIPEIYVCPACKSMLLRKVDGLRCSSCSKVYPTERRITDFLQEGLPDSRDPVLRRMRFIDKMARIYETKLWYPLVLAVYGGVEAPSAAITFK